MIPKEDIEPIILLKYPFDYGTNRGLYKKGLADGIATCAKQSVVLEESKENIRDEFSKRYYRGRLRDFLHLFPTFKLKEIFHLSYFYLPLIGEYLRFQYDDFITVRDFYDLTNSYINYIGQPLKAIYLSKANYEHLKNSRDVKIAISSLLRKDLNLIRDITDEMLANVLEIRGVPLIYIKEDTDTYINNSVVV